MKSERRFFAVLSLIAPLLYFAMYLPLWNGNELAMASPLTIGLALFQLLCLITAILQLVLRIRIGKATVVFNALFVISVLLTCFCGFFFLLTLLGIPWFPAQN